MDLEYLDPFNSTLPQAIDGILNEEGEHGLICAMQMSPAGLWLATGNDAGECQVWDLLTRSTIHCVPAPEELAGHKKRGVSSIAWRIEGRTLLIAYVNGLVVERSLGAGKFIRRHQMESGLLMALYNKSGQWVLADESRVVIMEEGMVLHEHVAEITAAHLNESARAIILGNAKGELNFLEASNLSLIGSSSEVGPSGIVKICTHHSKSSLLLTLHKDRTIRYSNLANRSTPEPKLKFVDVINKAAWAAAGFSHDGELAYGAIKAKGTHSICLWELTDGTIVRTLEGPREDLTEIRWHPKRPFIASLSKFGTVYLWKAQYGKRWAALFPGMTEVEENVYYVEREDEFDEVQVQREVTVVEPETVDILTPSPCISPEDLAEIRLFHST